MHRNASFTYTKKPFTTFGYLAFAPIEQQATRLSVASLINDEAKIQNIEMVRKLFCYNNTALILNIPLCHAKIPDRLFWLDSDVGQFSIKSTYFVTRGLLGRVNA